MKKIMLVSSAANRPTENQSKWARWSPPLGLISIATYLKMYMDLEIEIVDGDCILTEEEVRQKIINNKADIVGFSANVAQFDISVQLAKLAKANGSTVVFGGAMPSYHYKEILMYNDFIDYAVIFDGEESFLRICKGEPGENIPNVAYRKNGKIIKNNICHMDIRTLPIPDRSFVNMEDYFTQSQWEEYKICQPFRRPTAIFSQKGCVWRAQEGGRCVFCAIPHMDFQKRNPRVVWEEIRYLRDQYGIDFFWDVCDSLPGDKEWFTSFVDQKPEDITIPYSCYTRATCIDEETAAMLNKSGCCSVFIGMESGDEDSLKRLNKGITRNDILRAISILEKYNIGATLGIVLGCEGETKDSVKNTIEFCKQLYDFKNFDRLEWGTLIPLPGSDAFKKITNDPRLKHRYNMQEMFSGNLMYTMKVITEDWADTYTEVGFSFYLDMQKKIEKLGLVPYVTTRYQRRAWSGNPTRFFKWDFMLSPHKFEPKALKSKSLDWFENEYKITPEEMKVINRIINKQRYIINVKQKKSTKTKIKYTLTYNNGESIEISVKAKFDKRNPAVIWMNGFGKLYNQPPTAYFKIQGKDSNLVCISFNNSGLFCDITKTRYQQDLIEVIKFISTLDYVDNENIGLGVFSLQTFFALQVIQDYINIKRIEVVFPIFDIFTTVGAFYPYFQGGPLEVIWRSEPELRFPYNFWDRTEFSDFFGIRVRPTFAIDIITHEDPDDSRLVRFLTVLKQITANRQQIRFWSSEEDFLFKYHEVESILQEFINKNPSASDLIELQRVPAGHRKNRFIEADIFINNKHKLRKIRSQIWEDFENSLLSNVHSNRQDYPALAINS